MGEQDIEAYIIELEEIFSPFPTVGHPLASGQNLIKT